MITQVNAAGSWLERRTTLWFFVALIGLLFAVTNLPWHLDNYDQAKQAFTSFEMVNENHWLYQHTPNQKIATKPPIVGWISAGVFGVTRSWEMAWRLPSIGAAILLAFVLTRAARNVYGAAAGLLALGAFGLNLLSPRLAMLVRTDMPLALVVFLLGLKIWEKVRTGDPWRASDRFVMFALLTAAMLIKGPIVCAFLLPGILVFQWRNRSADQKANAWCGWWPWVASLAVFSLWVAGGIAWIPGFYEQVVLREFAGRFSETVHKSQPIYFYLTHLLHKFAPWSLLIIALAFVSWRIEKTKFAERWRRLSPEVTWLVCWSLGGLFLMSLIPSKRVDRIFPIVPPLCLLVAAQFSRLTQNSSIAIRAQRWNAIALVVAGLFTSAYAAQRIVRGYRADETALFRFGAEVRRAADENGWRYDVIGGREEGLLLYLRRTRFVTPAAAVERWKAGSLDALVIPAEELSRLATELTDATPSGLEASVTINDRPRRYLLLKQNRVPSG